MLYDQEPDAAAYERHAELCRKVPGGTFRLGDPIDVRVESIDKPAGKFELAPA